MLGIKNKPSLFFNQAYAAIETRMVSWHVPAMSETPEITQSVDVAIAGGGMVGLSLAIALAREGMQVAVVERDDPPSQLVPAFDGRVSAIAYGSQRLLSAIGVWEAMAEHAQPIWDIRVSDGDSPFFLDYDHRDVGTDPFGWIVENRYTRIALHQAANRYPNVHWFTRNEVAGFQADGAAVDVALRDGRAIRARLLVGAEGKRSRVRELAGIDVMTADYQQTAIVCTISHEEPHHGLAQERFLPAGPFAALPMLGKRSSLVWVEPTARAPLYMRMSAEEMAEEIRGRVGEYLGKVTVEGRVFSYPLALTQAQSYTAMRVALVGDAAHAIHPIAGQGVNLGFRDVGVLHALLSEQFKLGLDIGDAKTLAGYQQWRRFDNIAMIAVTDGLTRLFGVQFAPVRIARGLGLWAVGRMPRLKTFFMRHAMGVVGDLPPLMH